MNPTVRKILVWGCVVAVVGTLASYVLGYIAGSIDAHAPGTVSDSRWLPIVFFVFVAVSMVVSLWVTVLWMRSIDEAAREAHKSAWFWGGTVGMTVGLMLVLMSMWPGAETLNLPSMEGRNDPAAYMAMGAVLMLLIMVAGYTIAWIVWWWQRR